MVISDDIIRLLNKSKAYKAVFLKDGKLTPDGRVVLNDLMRFCKANASTVVVSPISREINPLASAYNEGKREVFLRIENYLKLDEATLTTTTTEDYDE